MKVGVGTMQGYAFIDQSSMRAAPGEAGRGSGARCEAHGLGKGGGGGSQLLLFLGL